MSDMRKVCAIRLKVGEFESRNDFYKFLKNVVKLDDSKFKEISYESHWISEENRFEETNIVDYFELTDYNYVVDYDTNTYYIDKRLFDRESSDDMSLTLSLEDMQKYVDELHKIFMSDKEVKFVAYDWYTGCDEPAYF